MNVRLRDAQWRVFRHVARFRVLAAGRRFGKTYLALTELCRAAWGPGRTVWYVAPTYKQAKRITWAPLKQMTRAYWAAKPNESDLRIELISGGSIALRGADNYDALRGDGLDFIVLDEYASMAPQAWSEVLRPALSDRRGRALFIGTPKGFNHFYDLFQNAGSQPDWAAFQFTTEQGGNVAREELEGAARELDERTYRQEFQARFENLAHGLVYYAFDRSQNVQPAGYLSQHAVCWSLDFNVNPMCSIIAQIEDQSTRLERLSGRTSVRVNVIDEIVLSDSNTLEACQMFAERMQQAYPGRVIDVQLYGDAAGGARSTAGKSDYQIIREFFRTQPQYRVSYHVPRDNPAVRDRVNAVNAMLCNQQGLRRLSIDPRCRRLIRDLERVVWKADSNGNLGAQLDKSNPELTHASDALGYLLEQEFGIHPAGGWRSEFIA
jgi:Terminase large subunit, T4likevirus-type, N-terminal